MLYTLIVAVLLIFFIPTLKSYGVKKITQYVTFQGKKVVEFDNIKFNWFDLIEISNLQIKDDSDSLFLSVSKAVIDISIIGLLFDNETHIDQLDLDSMKLYVYKNSGSTDYNISNFIKKYFRKKSSKGKPVYIDKLTLSNSIAHIVNRNSSFRREGLNPNNLELTQLNGEIAYLFISDSIYADINKMNFSESNSSLEIKNLQSNLVLTKKKMELDNFRLETDQSIIQDSIRLNFNGFKALRYIYDSVRFDVRLNDTRLATSDIEKVLGRRLPGNDKYLISLRGNGKLSNLNLKSTRIAFGNTSYVSARAFLNGLPKLDETFFDIRLTDSKITPEDLQPYFKLDIADKFKLLGQFSYTGLLTGFINDFVSKGKVALDAGTVDTDIKIKLNTQELEQTSYDGTIVLDSVDLSKLLHQNMVRKVSLQGQVKGKGISRKTISFELDGQIRSMQTKYYDIRNIVTNGKFALNFFDGQFTINDPKLKMRGSARLDLSKGSKSIDLQTSIDTIYAKEIFNLDQEYFASMNIDLNAGTDKRNDVTGNVLLENLLITNFKDTIEENQTTITSFITDKRVIELVNDDFQIIIDGSFDIGNVLEHISSFSKEIKMSLLHTKKEVETYYEQKNSQDSSFYLNYLVKINQINPWLQVVYPSIQTSDNWEIDGTYSTQGQFSTFTTNAQLPYIQLNKRVISNLKLDLNLSKPSHSTEVLGYILMSADSLNLNIQNPSLSVDWNGNELDINTYAEQESSSSIIDLYSTIIVDEASDSLFYWLRPSSKILILDEYWLPSETNSLKFATDYVQLNDFLFTNKRQAVTIQGALSNSLSDALNITFDSLDISTLSLLSRNSLSGTSTGSVTLKILNDNLLAESNFRVNDLILDSIFLGDVLSKSEWFTETKSMSVDVSLMNNEVQNFSLEGKIHPYKKYPLKLTARLDQLSITPLQKLFKKHTSFIEGNTNGSISITGKINNPLLEGELNVWQGKTHLKYFNTNYDFEGTIKLSENQIRLDQMIVRDPYFNRGSINGVLSHSNFRDLNVNISIDTDMLQVTNTSFEDNQLYYGNIFVSGRANFFGPLTDLIIDAKATTQKGTRLYIPVDDKAEGRTENFISFINLQDTSRTLVDITDSINSNIKGIKMSLLVEVTPEAYGEIIFDIKSGDIIRGSGKGNLNLNLDTRGEFTMFGGLSIEKGGYNFTLQNVINKEFDIKEGSRISWHGDPYKARLDIDATYRQLTSLRPLITDLEREDLEQYPELSTKYPAFVNLNLQEQMLSPKIKFGISIEDYPQNLSINGKTLQTYVNIFQNSLLSDEQELNRQVFSLIILKKLAAQQNLSFEGTLNNSVSELISNQVSYWINQIDDNLEIDVDLNSLDADALSTLQLKLAYTLLDGRLKISRDGNFADNNNYDETTEENTTEFSTLIGNISVEYLLTKDGKLRAKMYSRQSTNSNLDEINQRNETGFSLRFTKSFNRFFGFIDDLIKQKREEERKNP